MNAPLTLADVSLWGAKAVARFLGCSEKRVYTSLLNDPTCPVTKRGNSIFARRDELEKWTRAATLGKTG